MRIPLIATLAALTLTGCMPAAQSGSAVPRTFASAEEGCRLEAAFLTGVSPSAIRVLGSPSADTLLLDLGGRNATCRLDSDGRVTSIEL